MFDSNSIISNRSAATGGGGTGGGNNPPTSPQTQSQSPKGNAVSFIGGVSLPEHLHDAATSLQHARQDGFDYVVTALPDTTSSGDRGIDGSDGRTDAAARAGANVVPNGAPGASSAGGNSSRRRTDVTRLESKWWSTSVVGAVCDPPRWRRSNGAAQMQGEAMDDAMDEGGELLKALTSTSGGPRKEEAHKVFWGMMEWASHMNIPAVILPPVPLTEHVGSAFPNGGANREGVVPIHSDEEDDMFADAPGEGNKRGRIFHRTHPSNAAAAVQSNGNQPPAIDVNNASAKEYARLLSHLSTSPACASSARVQLWVRVPLSLPHLRAFQLLLARCDHNPSVGCMIYISRRIDVVELPAIVKALHGFVGGGNVRAVSWDCAAFLKNKKGYPTLSKNLQFLFQLLFGRLGRTLRTLVEGRAAPDPVAGQQQPPGSGSQRLHHLQYLRHLRSSRPSLLAKLDSEEAVLETPYLDSLQSPLQPLGDHLEYQTYETFERDPVKYKRYGEAIARALGDGLEGYAYLGSAAMSLGQIERMGGPDPGGFDDRYGAGEAVEVDVHQVTILVVGAGRGPLVREAVDAVARVSAAAAAGGRGGRRRRALYAKIVAVEKNPSAVLYLQSLKQGDPSWNGGHEYDEEGPSGGGVVVPGTSDVTVVGCDMRKATSHPVLRRMAGEAASGADVVVSELLGSFGDNELSPECLDGVQACGILKEGCVSVPQSYTAFIAPVSSARLHSEAKTQSCLPLNTNEGPASPSVGMQRAMETPYVVRTHAASQTHEERPCWTFSHPHAASEASDDMDASSDINGDSGCSPSARAAKNADNDRLVHLSFRHDPTHGAGSGCGYGALDPEVASVAAASPPTEADATLTIHGFLGTFHSVLYGENWGEGQQQQEPSVISIAPHSFSVGMFSWFPLFFPLKEPLRVPPGATLNCSIWRRSDDGRVWYEWCAEVVTMADNTHEATAMGGEASPVVWGASSIHNPGGRSYHVNK